MTKKNQRVKTGQLHQPREPMFMANLAVSLEKEISLMKIVAKLHMAKQKISRAQTLLIKPLGLRYKTKIIKYK
jgi:hypothetical protein